MKIAALIVAAGRGTRAGPGAPKQWRPLAGRRVVDWTLAAFDRPDITTRALVIHPEDRAEAAALASTRERRKINLRTGYPPGSRLSGFFAINGAE